MSFISLIARLTIVGFSASALGLLAALPAGALDFLGNSTDSFTNKLTELPHDDGSTVLTLNKYNGSSTLQEVRFIFNTKLVSSGTVTNNASTAQTFTIKVAGSYGFYPVTGAPSAIASYYEVMPDNLVGSQKYTSLAAKTTKNFGTGTNFANPYEITASQTFTLSNVDLSDFHGSGTFQFTPETLIGTTATGGGGNVATSIQTYADAGVTVEYYGTTAVAVPFEFSQLEGVALGLPLFFGLRSLRKRRAGKLTASKATVAVR